MPQYRAFAGDEPHGTIVVRLIKDGGMTRAFIRQVIDPGDIAEDSVEQSEELPVEEALALARNKAANIEGGADIVVDLAPETQWDEKWGRLA